MLTDTVSHTEETLARILHGFRLTQSQKLIVFYFMTFYSIILYF